MNKENGVHSVFMLRPNNFGFNNDTKSSNPWQNDINFDQKYIAKKATQEFDDMVEVLTRHDIKVHVLKDSLSAKLPDAIFLNNWFTITPHHDLFLFPLASESRRGERRRELIAQIQAIANIKNTVDLSDFEKEQMFLESTGSIVFDYIHKYAFASISGRTNEKLFDMFCSKINYKGFVFNCFDLKGLPIYHTNVLLSIASEYAIVCLDTIENNLEKAYLSKLLEKCGKEIIKISIHQMLNFAGNCMEVYDQKGLSKLVISRTGYSALKADQIAKIEKYSEFVIVNISIIERVGGGSARCMMMGIPTF